jgi:hypothetical protein
MIFTNSRSILQKNKNNKFEFRKQTYTNSINKNAITKSNRIILETNKQFSSQKLLWGPPIWFLFHTMAEKLKPTSFLLLKGSLINIIKKICSNLPCPECSRHSIMYMDTLDLTTMNSKEDFKHFLFEFHNSVNVRKKQSVFQRLQLDEKYKNANFYNIIVSFFSAFLQKSKNIRQLSDDFHKKSIAKYVSMWLKENRDHFTW